MNEDIYKLALSFCSSLASLNVNYSKQYNALRDTFAESVNAEPQINTVTILYSIINKTKLPVCQTCGKQVDIYNFKTGKPKLFCNLECKHNFKLETRSGDVFTDYEKLFDVNNSLSQSRITKYFNSESIAELKRRSELRTDDIKTLLTEWKFGKEKIKQCEECNKIIPVVWCKENPYHDDVKFCSNECRNKSETYKDGIRQHKLGVSRNKSVAYQTNVSKPWFVSKLNKILSLENIQIDCTYEDYLINESNHKYDCVCYKCNHKFKYTLQNKIPFCPKCNLNSRPQKRFVDFITSLGFEVIINDRVTISPYELDIVIPELKLAIEYDGLYFHRNKNDYHKFEMCKSLGIRLIKIFDDENEEIAFSRLKSILGKTDTKIYARQCEVKLISSKVHSEFLLENHIQGKANANVKLGLFKGKELVSVMSFGKCRFDKHHEYELIRFASKLNHSVIGGASKLFSYFIKTVSPTSIVSYCDIRWGTGNVYEKLGFKLKHQSKPNHYWYKQKRESRVKYQKHKLLKMFDVKNPKMTEDQIMIENGFSKIFDFGNYVYTWNKIE